MDILGALLIALVVIVALYEVARRFGLPYPALFVVGGVVLGFVPGLPTITLEPDLVLLVFLPPLLFGAAFETPIRDLRTNLWPIARLAVGLVLATTVAVAAVAQAMVPEMGWAAALALGAIVAPTDALAATAVFRKLGVPRIVTTLVEGEALFNDATALIAYRAAVAAAVATVTVAGAIPLRDAALAFVVAGAGGVLLGYVAGRLVAAAVKRLDDPPVEVVISLVVPFLVYLPAERLGVSGVLAVVTAGLVVGRRMGSILSADSRLTWLTTWRMVGFVLNGLAFVLIGQALPAALSGPDAVGLRDAMGVAIAVTVVVIAVRYAWVGLASLLPNSPRRRIARRDPVLAWRLVALVGWSGLRGAVSLAAALALPATFPERNLILIVTFVVILVTLVGQGLTLPIVIRWVRWDGVDEGDDDLDRARSAVYAAGLEAIRVERERWPTHQPLFDRLEAGLHDRQEHLATDDPDETAARRTEQLEHLEIRNAVVAAERAAILRLRDGGTINDATLRVLERELDLDELQAEA